MAREKINTLFNYIGGKGWMRAHLNADLECLLAQKKFTTYCEPFAGGLGAFLNLTDTLLKYNVKKVILSDVNATLINFYEVVRASPSALIKEYELLEHEFKAAIPMSAYSLHKTKEKEALKSLLAPANVFYQKVRTDFNNNTAIGDKTRTSAQLLFLQNHCFNGVYRENSKGHYNTPFNWEAKIFTTDKINDKIMAVHKTFALFDLELKIGSFENLDFNLDTLYYVDPPYFNDSLAPENKYNKDFFDMKKQELLLSTIAPCSFIYSNHDSDKLLEAVKKLITKKITVKKIARKNIISSSVASRQTDKIELLISAL